MSRLGLSLLGPFEATLDGRAVVGFRSDKVRALLVFLAVEASRPHTREALAGLLWPDCPNATALTYLRHALANLRHLIENPAADPAIPSPSFLLITRETVQLNPTAAVSLDVVALTHLLAGQPSLGSLEQAVALCRGLFLEGFTLEGSPAFDEWLLFKREQVNRQVLSALHRLTEAYLAQGQYARAEVYARRQLELDAWDEAAHRQLMVALALDGRRSAALAHYEICRHGLAQELNVTPARETIALYDSIRTATLHAVLSRPHAAPYPTSSVVTREHELAQLHRHLDLALAGDGRVVFVTGDAGSGKTTLLRQFGQSALATQGSVVVASGGCSAPLGVGDPYLPFGEVIRMLTGDIEAQPAGGLTPEHAQRLWAVVPAAAQALVETALDLVDRFVSAEALALRVEAVTTTAGRAPASTWRARLADHVKRQADGNTLAPMEQTHLFEQVTTFLHTLARRQPLILLLDDLQWADTGSLSLLFHLGRHLAGSRILVVGAYRPEDVALGGNGGPHPLATVVHELQRDFGESELDLNQAEGRVFIEALLDGEPNRLDEAFRATLYRHTEGHPLFTVELLRAMQERGELTRDDAGRWEAGQCLDWERLPRRVEAAIAERVERLPAEYRALLEVAAIEGEAFTAEVVARVLGDDARQVAHELSGPLSKQHRIVVADSIQRFDGQRLSRYHFRHALFQNYVYHRLDEVERGRLHEAVGTSLESLYATSEEPGGSRAPQLAWHFEQAGLIAKAVYYRRQAGDQALRLSACEEALAHYRRALALLVTLPPSPERVEQELALQQAVTAALLITEGWGSPAIQDALSRASVLARTIGATPQLVSTLADLADAFVGQGELQKGLDMAQEVLYLAQQDQQPLAQVVAHCIMAEARFFQGELQTARDHLEQALALYFVDPAAPKWQAGVELSVTCLTWLAWVQMALGYPDQAHRSSRQAIARAYELADPPTLGFALAIAGATFHVFRREIETAQDYAVALTRLAAEKGLAFFRAPAMIVEGMVQVREERTEAGLAQMHRGLTAWQETSTTAGRVGFLVLLSKAYAMAGRVEPALEIVAEAMQVAEQRGLGFYTADLWRLRGDLLARGESVDAAEVEACFQQAIILARRQGARWWELRATASLARLWQRQGRMDEALALLAEIYGWFTEGAETPDLREARALLEELGYNTVIPIPISIEREARDGAGTGYIKPN